MTSDDRDGGDVQPRDEHADRPELDFETAFADLKLRFETQVTTGVGPWPAAEDVDGDGAAGTDSTDRRRTGIRAVSAGDDGDDDATGRNDPTPVSDPAPPRRRTVLPIDAVYGVEPPTAAPVAEEGYTPPEPPPLPRGDLVSRLAWAGVIGGPVFLLLAALVWRDLPAGLLLAALIAFVGGFVTLVARMPGEPPQDDDDGAVV